MTDSRLYITLNRASEWKRCLLDNLTISENTVTYREIEEQKNTAVMITGSVDSSEHNFIWRNLLVDLDIGENSIFKVYAYSSNTTLASIDGRTVELDSLISDDSIAAAERSRLIAPLFKPLFTNCFDGLINMCGRYIWIKLEFIAAERNELVLRKLKLLLKCEQMIDYLPEIYRVKDGKNGFLSRFLAMFDGLFFDMDRKIDCLGERLDYKTAGGDMLRYLAQWICVDDYAYADDGELRRKMENAILNHRLTGTKKGIINWIESEYGVTPNIIEYFNVKKMLREGSNKDVYFRLLGDDRYKFFILLPENVFADAHASNHFMKRLKENIPAYTEAEVVILRKNIILSGHTYLGVNSVIGGYRTASIESGALISHNLILGGSNNE